LESPNLAYFLDSWTSLNSEFKLVHIV
jgi:hypothetical protein